MKTQKEAAALSKPSSPEDDGSVIHSYQNTKADGISLSLHKINECNRK